MVVQQIKLEPFFSFNRFQPLSKSNELTLLKWLLLNSQKLSVAGNKH
jgi:hypothetical protein